MGSSPTGDAKINIGVQMGTLSTILRLRRHPVKEPTIEELLEYLNRDKLDRPVNLLKERE